MLIYYNVVTCKTEWHGLFTTDILKDDPQEVKAPASRSSH